jgi:ATP-citrate lyase beta-subunit
VRSAKQEEMPILVGPETDMKKVAVDNPWLKNKRLVVKPDQLFGKRGKSGLILLDASWAEASKFISGKMKKMATVGGVKGKLTHFLVEPYVEHDKEFYVAIRMEEDGDVVYFSTRGGMDIEEVWDSVVEDKIPVLEEREPDTDKLLKGMDKGTNKIISPFLRSMYKFFRNADIAYLEINPFTLVDKKIRILDTVCRVDDTALYRNVGIWDDLEFPTPFGRVPMKEEAYIKSLDEKTGASLKLTILNEKGRIWTLVAGGGASVVYADTIVDLGFGDQLANYGEYSGNPSTEETYLYTKTILSMMTKNKDKSGKGKVLLIGGGIANFTDVANTFTGIIKALKEYADDLKKVGCRIYVRRGGPNYKAGLEKMRRVGDEIGIPIKVHGPEVHMTRIVPMALIEDERGVA